MGPRGCRGGHRLRGTSVKAVWGGAGRRSASAGDNVLGRGRPETPGSAPLRVGPGWGGGGGRGGGGRAGPPLGGACWAPGSLRRGRAVGVGPREPVAPPVEPGRRAAIVSFLFRARPFPAWAESRPGRARGQREEVGAGRRHSRLPVWGSPWESRAPENAVSFWSCAARWPWRAGGVTFSGVSYEARRCPPCGCRPCLASAAAAVRSFSLLSHLPSKLCPPTPGRRLGGLTGPPTPGSCASGRVRSRKRRGDAAAEAHLPGERRERVPAGQLPGPAAGEAHISPCWWEFTSQTTLQLFFFSFLSLQYFPRVLS